MKKAFGSIGMALMLLCLSAPAGAAELGGVDIHGFVSQGFLYSDEYNYLATDTKDGSFEYNEMGINFGKQLSDKLRIGAQFFSRDLGDAANNKVTLDWAYADYRQWDWLGLRAGRIKSPLGLYNETRDMDMLRTSIVLPQGMYNDLLRDSSIALNGVGLYGNVPMGGAGSLDYQVLAGVINIDLDSGVGKYANDAFAGGGEITNTTTDTSYVASLRWETPLAGLRLGGSYAMVPAASAGNISIEIPPVGVFDGTLEGSAKNYNYVLSAEYTWNNLVLAAEYSQSKLKNITTMEFPDFPLANSTITGRTTSECYYVSASYRFNPLFTLGAYYSEYYPDKDDKDGDGLAIDHAAWEKDLALTLRFDINEYWIFKIEGHAVDGTANVLAVDNAGNDFAENNWYYGAAKLSFNF